MQSCVTRLFRNTAAGDHRSFHHFFQSRLARAVIHCCFGYRAAIGIRPESGQVLRRIETDEPPPTSVLFASKRVYYAVWSDKDQHPSIVKSN
jgi:hypothetical protein